MANMFIIFNLYFSDIGMSRKSKKRSGNRGQQRKDCAWDDFMDYHEAHDDFYDDVHQVAKEDEEDEFAENEYIMEELMNDAMLDAREQEMIDQAIYESLLTTDTSSQHTGFGLVCPSEFTPKEAACPEKFDYKTENEDEDLDFPTQNKHRKIIIQRKQKVKADSKATNQEVNLDIDYYLQPHALPVTVCVPTEELTEANLHKMFGDNLMLCSVQPERFVIKISNKVEQELKKKSRVEEELDKRDVEVYLILEKIDVQGNHTVVK